MRSLLLSDGPFESCLLTAILQVTSPLENMYVHHCSKNVKGIMNTVNKE